MTASLSRRTALRSAAAAVVGASAVGALASCTSTGTGARAQEDGARGGTTTPARPRRHEVSPGTAGRAGTVDLATSPDAAAVTLAASRALLEAATVVVVASGDDLAGATATARRLGIPLLVDGPGLEAELDRLGTRTVVHVAPPGSATATASPSVPAAVGEREVLDGTDADALASLPGLPLSPPPAGALVLVAEEDTVPASVAATLAAVGATSVTVSGPDPRTAPEALDAVRRGERLPVLSVGRHVGPAERFAQRVRTARHATELPGGGLLPFPGRRMVALYGHPSTAALGMLGEQPASASVRRARELAREYAALTGTEVVPAFELIATVASGSPQKDGSYSRRTPVRTLLPYVEAAERSGTYVVLDLQPGRDDFLTQARHYEELLRRPWVGLALDPEWRLQPGEKPLRQIGHVGIDEVNEVGAWLAALVREHDLPPKVLTLHQFRPSMVRDRERLDTSLDEVQWLVHADGQGGQNAKQGTWAALRRDLPDGVWLGWKNFEDEDSPMLTPAQTVARVRPTPWFVSYQ